MNGDVGRPIVLTDRELAVVNWALRRLVLSLNVSYTERTLARQLREGKLHVEGTRS